MGIDATIQKREKKEKREKREKRKKEKKEKTSSSLPLSPDPTTLPHSTYSNCHTHAQSKSAASRNDDSPPQLPPSMPPSPPSPTSPSSPPYLRAR
jgi:hypothetical protein